jgi:hypothetical protein
MAYEAHLEQINDLRRRSIDAATLARAFDDYAENLTQIKTKGDIADLAAMDLKTHAHKRAEQVRRFSQSCIERADAMEREGLA